jgi:hypothetical protein
VTEVGAAPLRMAGGVSFTTKGMPLSYDKIRD